MRAAVVSAVLVAAALWPCPAMARSLVEVRPHLRLAPARFVVEYARPWAGLPVEQTRMSLGAQLPWAFRVGAATERTSTPVVTEWGLGAWLARADRVRIEWVRRNVTVEGFPAARRDEVFVGVAAHPGPWRLGASMEFIGLDAGARRAEEWWCGVEHAFAELLLRRARSVWTGEAVWAASLWISAGRGAGLGLSLAPAGSEFLFSWSAGWGRVLARSTWSGPRAGALALRWAVR